MSMQKFENLRHGQELAELMAFVQPGPARKVAEQMLRYSKLEAMYYDARHRGDMARMQRIERLEDLCVTRMNAA